MEAIKRFANVQLTKPIALPLTKKCENTRILEKSNFSVFEYLWQISVAEITENKRR